MVENNFPPNIIREERQRLLFFRSKRMRSATGMENAWAREGRGGRNEIGYLDWSIEFWIIRVISACISTCFQRVIPWESGPGGWEGGRGWVRGCARERASSSSPPRSLHRNYSTAYWSNDSQAHGSQNPSLKQPSFSTPAPDTLSFRGGEKARPRRRATEKKGASVSAVIYMYGEIIIVDDVVCVCLWIYIQGRGVVNLGNIYVLYCAKVSSSIFQTMYNLILLLNVLEGEKKEGRIVKPCMHESLKF